MTTTIKKTKLGDNPPIENTEGAPLDGFQDPTGEYPKSEYFYGSSINRSARGLKVENLYLGGSTEGADLDLEDQEPSRFPFNQVKETSSGHIISYDDTPGGERILIKHRKGAGVEVRADGSVVISALKNKVEVTGGDQTVIVEGNGKLVYNGDLTLEVTGDYNVNVGGDYNLNVNGNSNTDIRKNNQTVVGRNSKYETKGTATNKTVEHQVDLVLGNRDHITKGYYKHNVGSLIELFTGNYFQVSAEENISMSALQANIQATEVSVLGMKGTIGGEQVEFTGPVYMGPKEQFPLRLAQHSMVHSKVKQPKQFDHTVPTMLTLLTLPKVQTKQRLIVMVPVLLQMKSVILMIMLKQLKSRRSSITRDLSHFRLQSEVC